MQGYLLYVATTFVAPSFAANVLGPPLGPKSGGLVVKRSLQAWLSGMQHRHLVTAGMCLCRSQSGRLCPCS